MTKKDKPTNPPKEQQKANPQKQEETKKPTTAPNQRQQNKALSPLQPKTIQQQINLVDKTATKLKTVAIADVKSKIKANVQPEVKPAKNVQDNTQNKSQVQNLPVVSGQVKPKSKEEQDQDDRDQEEKIKRLNEMKIAELQKEENEKANRLKDDTLSANESEAEESDEAEQEDEQQLIQPEMQMMQSKPSAVCKSKVNDSADSDSASDRSDDEPVSEQSDEELVEFMKTRQNTPINWQQSDDIQTFAEQLETQFDKALDKCPHDKVTDAKFAANLKAVLKYKADNFIDIRLRKHTAKHKAPRKFANESDATLSRETAAFQRTMVRPTHQLSLVIQQSLDDVELRYWRDNVPAEVQTQRFVYLLVSVYGKDVIKQNKGNFLVKLVEFHKEFGPKLPS